MNRSNHSRQMLQHFLSSPVLTGSARSCHRSFRYHGDHFFALLAIIATAVIFEALPMSGVAAAWC
eukprot:3262755-Pyramimonas_sp.AAC.1